MAHPSNPFYFDGDYGTPLLQSRSPREYPFRRLGDVTTAIFPEVYAVDINKFTPTKGGTAHPTESGFYLLSESQPEIFQGKIATFTRVYGTIPTQQTDYSTLSLTKPSPAALGSSGLNFYNSAGVFITNQAAIYAGYYWGDGEVYGPPKSATSSFTTITCAGHGLTGTETILVRFGVGANTLQVVAPAGYTVVDPNTLTYSGFGGTSVFNVSPYLRDYTPGTDRVRCKILSDFDLDPLALPVPSPLLNDAEFMAAVIANPTGWLDYDARDLVAWRDSAIYQLDRIQIDMANV